MSQEIEKYSRKKMESCLSRGVDEFKVSVSRSLSAVGSINLVGAPQVSELPERELLLSL